MHGIYIYIYIYVYIYLYICTHFFAGVTIFIYVFMYIFITYMNEYIYVSIYTYILISICTYVYVQMYIHTHTYKETQGSDCESKRKYTGCIYVGRHLFAGVFIFIYVCMYIYIYIYTCIHLYVCLYVFLYLYQCTQIFMSTYTHIHIQIQKLKQVITKVEASIQGPYMGWLRWVGCLKIQVSLQNTGLFCRALLQKRPIFLSILLIVATPYAGRRLFAGVSIFTCIYIHIYIHIYSCLHVHKYTHTEVQRSDCESRSKYTRSVHARRRLFACWRCSSPLFPGGCFVCVWVSQRVGVWVWVREWVTWVVVGVSARYQLWMLLWIHHHPDMYKALSFRNR